MAGRWERMEQKIHHSCYCSRSSNPSICVYIRGSVYESSRPYDFKSDAIRAKEWEVKQKPRELKRFVIADLGLVPRPSKHSWVMILWLIIIIIIMIIVNVPKTSVRVGLKVITKLSRVW